MRRGGGWEAPTARVGSLCSLGAVHPLEWGLWEVEEVPGEGQEARLGLWQVVG